MKKYHEAFRVYASAIREMNDAMQAVNRYADDPSSVAYHGAEMVQYAGKAQSAREMLHSLVMDEDELSFYSDAFEVAESGDTSALWTLFRNDDKKEN